MEIVDSGMVRLAGTGEYAAGIGTSLGDAGEVYKEAMRKRETILVRSPRHHVLCAGCPGRESCREVFLLVTPIMDGEKPLGVIGLACFSDAERSRVLESLDSYTAFISFFADALAHKIGAQGTLAKATQLLEQMLKAVDAPGQGIMLFDDAGILLFCNPPARDFCGLPPEAALSIADIKSIGSRLCDFEEFRMTLPGGETHTLLGKMTVLRHSIHGSMTLFVFELPARFPQVSDVQPSGGGEAGFGKIIGTSPPLLALKARAMRVANSTSTVLLTGESGTGKELLARAIHQASSRWDKPFIAINCGGIPDTLLESELFGYTSGAFTGASAKGRMGKFELAEGGVIFLDEISSMPLSVQVKLLRVLQERVLVRLGSNRLVHVSARVFAASNENLADCISRNTFRKDLYYRLNVIPMDIPPLRERTGDIHILAVYFLEKYCTLFNKSKPRLRSAFLPLLAEYSWPGNVRELEHIIEYAVNMMPDSGALGLESLPSKFLDKLKTPSQACHADVCPSDEPQGGIEPLAVMEERAIRNALARYGRTTAGKKAAAGALGLSLATLYRKMNTFSM